MEDKKDIQKKIEEINGMLAKIQEDVLNALEIGGIEFIDLKYVSDEVNILKNKKRELENQLRFE